MIRTRNVLPATVNLAVRAAVLVCTVVVSSTLADAPAASQPAKKEPAPDIRGEGFVPIFDGKTLDGWRRENGTATYSVEDGCIIGVCDPKSKANTFLRTEKTFRNFIFTAEAKFDVVGNSGIQFRSNQRDGDGRVYGYQCEMDSRPQRQWSGGIYDEARRTWLNTLEGEANAAARKAFSFEDWNTFVIKADGRRLQTWINGVPCADYIDNDEKDFTPEGFFALQVHAGAQGQIRWRNVRLKVLPDTPAAARGATSRPADQAFLPPAPAGKSWRLVWHDEFDGTTLDESKWDVPPDGPRRDAFWVRRAISLDGKGNLMMRTFKEDGKYFDGCVRTQGKFEHSFGYYEARIRLQRQPGHWSAFWLYDKNVNRVGDEGRDGTEIDIMEKPWLDDRIQQTLHWDGYGDAHKTKGQIANVPGVMEGFHTFGLNWTPSEYVFYVDGKETWRTNAGGVCQVPLYLKLSDEVGDWGGDIAKAVLPDEFLVDYVRVYSTD